MAGKPSTKKRPTARKAKAPRPRSRRPKPPKVPITPADDRHERFAQEYLIDLNPSAAYRRVYGDAIAPNTAWTNGYNLLRNTEVADRIAELKDLRAKRMHLEQDRVLRQVLDIAECDPGNVYGPDGSVLHVMDMDPRTRNAIAAMKVRRVENQRNTELAIDETVIELKFWDKHAASRTMMQHMGMLTEKHEVTGRDGAPLPSGAVIILPSNDRDA